MTTPRRLLTMLGLGLAILLFSGCELEDPTLATTGELVLADSNGVIVPFEIDVTTDCATTVDGIGEASGTIVVDNTALDIASAVCGPSSLAEEVADYVDYFETARVWSWGAPIPDGSLVVYGRLSELGETLVDADIDCDPCVVLSIIGGPGGFEVLGVSVDTVRDHVQDAIDDGLRSDDLGPQLALLEAYEDKDAKGNDRAREVLLRNMIRKAERNDGPFWDRFVELLEQL